MKSQRWHVDAAVVAENCPDPGPLLDRQAVQRTPFSFNSPTLHAQYSNSG